jgi:RNase H-fold protein (predicted Holliday junction resolvase)
MKYLAVDYGKRNIGLAISDSAGSVAMPFGVFENNNSFLEKFKEIVSENNIDEVVIGESKNLQGERNLIQDKIDLFIDFVDSLEIKNHSVSEVMTSMESK